jgi:Domain of unknown function (DUF4263)
MGGLEPEAAVRFIRTYYESIDSELGSFPMGDRRLFPQHMIKPYQVRVRMCRPAGVAFYTTRIVRARSFPVSSFEGSPIQAVGLPYSEDEPAVIGLGVCFSNVTIVLVGTGARADFEGRRPTETVILAKPGKGFVRFATEGDLKLVGVRVIYGSGRQQSILAPPFVWMFSGVGTASRLTEPNARAEGKRDFDSQLTFLAFTVNPEDVSGAARAILIAHIRRLQAEFRELILRTDVLESDVQHFLEASQFILESADVACIPQVRLGADLVTDFVLNYPDGTYRLVEIERPGAPLARSTGLGKVTAHAVSQVRDWMRWLETGVSPASAARPRVTGLLWGSEVGSTITRGRSWTHLTQRTPTSC